MKLKSIKFTRTENVGLGLKLLGFESWNLRCYSICNLFCCDLFLVVMMFLTANLILLQEKTAKHFSALMAFRQSVWPGVFPRAMNFLNCLCRASFSVFVHTCRITSERKDSLSWK